MTDRNTGSRIMNNEALLRLANLMSDETKSIAESVRNRTDKDEFPEGSLGRLISDVVYAVHAAGGSRKDVVEILMPTVNSVFDNKFNSEIAAKERKSNDKKNPRDD